MSYNNNKIRCASSNDGISIKNLQDCFQTPVSSSSSALSDNLGHIITYAGINRWAKYKPVVYLDANQNPVLNTVGQLTTDSGYFKWKDTSNWWKGNDTTPGASSGGIYTCGLRIALYTSVADLITDYDNYTSNPANSTYAWKYIRPNITDKKGFRILDFLDYNDSATNAHGNIFQPDKLIFGTEENVTLSVNNPSTTTSSSNSLTLVDLGLGDCYFGVIVWKKTTTTYKVKTMSTTIRNSSQLSVSFNESSIGEYYTLPAIFIDAHTLYAEPLLNISMYSLELERKSFSIISGTVLDWIKVKSFSWNKLQNGALHITAVFSTMRYANDSGGSVVGSGEGNCDTNNNGVKETVRIAKVIVTARKTRNGVLEAATPSNYASQTYPDPNIQSTSYYDVPCRTSEDQAESTATHQFNLDISNMTNGFDHITVAVSVHQGNWESTSTTDFASHALSTTGTVTESGSTTSSGGSGRFSGEEVNQVNVDPDNKDNPGGIDRDQPALEDGH